MFNVFVYGTLKPGEINYQRYCASRTFQQIPAYAWGQLYNLNLGYPAMTEGTAKVRGYWLSFARDEVLEALDRLEGYQSDRPPEKNEYQRRLIEVYSLADRCLGLAWCYLMNPQKIDQFSGVKNLSGCWSSSQN